MVVIVDYGNLDSHTIEVDDPINDTWCLCCSHSCKPTHKKAIQQRQVLKSVSLASPISGELYKTTSLGMYDCSGKTTAYLFGKD